MSLDVIVDGFIAFLNKTNTEIKEICIWTVIFLGC